MVKFLVLFPSARVSGSEQSVNDRQSAKPFAKTNACSVSEISRFILGATIEGWSVVLQASLPNGAQFDSKQRN